MANLARPVQPQFPASLAKTNPVASLNGMSSAKVNLVTGATGQLGSHIVEQLRAAGETDDTMN